MLGTQRQQPVEQRVARRGSRRLLAWDFRRRDRRATAHQCDDDKDRGCDAEHRPRDCEYDARDACEGVFGSGDWRAGCATDMERQIVREVPFSTFIARIERVDRRRSNVNIARVMRDDADDLAVERSRAVARYAALVAKQFELR